MHVNTPNRRFFVVITGVAIIFLGVFVLLNFHLAGLTGGGVPVLLYYYNPELDQGPGGVACSANGLVAVERTLPRSKTLPRDTLHLLIEGRLTTEERNQGVTTEFPLVDFSLLSVDVRDGVATITFLDPANQASGGACRVNILRAEVEATAKQFSSIREVRIEPAGVFEP